jgi:dipeptidyl aminopeptidase/acylaminoacyl peptidase
MKTARRVLVLLAAVSAVAASQVFTPTDLLSLRGVSAAEISPDGEWIAYTLSVPRGAAEPAGTAYSELHLVPVKGGASRPYITGKVSVNSPKWRPDGSGIAFISRRGDDAAPQVWLIPTTGGEARRITRSETPVQMFRWDPAGRGLAYVATTPETAREKELGKRGYGFIYCEENLKDANLYLQEVPVAGPMPASVQVTSGITVWGLEYAPDGRSIALAASPKNLVDHSYMFKDIHVLSLADHSLRRIESDTAKLGNLAFSPDGKWLAFGAALHKNDHQVSQAFVVPAAGGAIKNLTPPGFRGHVTWVGWRDNETVLFHSAEGVGTTLRTVSPRGGETSIVLTSEKAGMTFRAPSDGGGKGKLRALIGSSPSIPADVYVWEPGKGTRRLTTANPWLAERKLGKQEPVRYKARDGREIEGILISPVDARQGSPSPLIVVVHGGPESHYANDWITRYSEPGQVLAGKGYAVFYPNYRSSTGYGVEFAMEGWGDPAGKEFDDIADGIDHLVSTGIADRQRVGLGGGSYGGYASGWFATYYTKYVRAVCMFVGIANQISDRAASDIPVESDLVHFGKPFDEDWDLNLKRSPIYWAKQSRTATLIFGGASDTRVPPTQSVEMYRTLVMNRHPAVRLVQYPGEGHGNARQPGRIDVLHRTLQWYDWYVRDLKPLDGPMPSWDISDSYGLELPARETGTPPAPAGGR